MMQSALAIPVTKTRKAVQGYGLGLLMMVLLSMLVAMVSLQMTIGTSQPMLNRNIREKNTAHSVALAALPVARDYLQKQLDNNVTISQGFQWLSQTITAPADPTNLTGSTTTVGTYNMTVAEKNGDYYLVRIDATVGSSTDTVTRLFKIVTYLKQIQFIGRAASDNVSYPAAVGDVNGDGFQDFVIRASGVSSSTGEAYLVFGRSTQAWRTLTGGTNTFNLDNISEANRIVRFIGKAAGDKAGATITGVGDTNGDGIDDFVIGAYTAANGGEAYLIMGRNQAGWDALTAADGSFALSGITKANKMYRFIAGTTGIVFGRVGNAGDTNNDGYSDFLITAATAAPSGRASAGETYLLLGRSQTAWDTMITAADGSFTMSAANTTDANQMVRFLGAAANDQLGNSVSNCVGDVDNDGYDDFVIGAYNAASAAGKAYLIRGRSDWTATTPATDGVFDLSTISTVTDSVAKMTVFQGQAASDQLGISVNLAGDVNGDGYTDVILGANLADGTGTDMGEAYLVFGRSTANWDSLSPATDGLVALASNVSEANGIVDFIGHANSNEFGSPVGSAGDVNNDGYADILIGAIKADAGGGATSGAAYLIYGRSMTNWNTLIPTNGVVDMTTYFSQANGMVRFYGKNASDNLGRSGTLGDINMDGIDDLNVASQLADGGGTDSGEVYIFFGRNTTEWNSLTGSGSNFNLDNI